MAAITGHPKSRACLKLGNRQHLTRAGQANATLALLSIGYLSFAKGSSWLFHCLGGGVTHINPHISPRRQAETS